MVDKAQWEPELELQAHHCTLAAVHAKDGVVQCAFPLQVIVCCSAVRFIWENPSASIQWVRLRVRSVSSSWNTSMQENSDAFITNWSGWRWATSANFLHRGSCQRGFRQRPRERESDEQMVAFSLREGHQQYRSLQNPPLSRLRALY
jgi:hypothetical protein